MAQGHARNGRQSPDASPSEPAADDRHSRVGDVLRKAYDETLEEPVPDVFADLLRKLG